MMIVQPRLDVVQHRKLLEQTDILKGTGNAVLVDFNGLMSCNIFSVQPDKSLVRLIDAGQKIEYRRLPRAVGADQPVQLPFLDLKVEIIHSTEAAKGDRQIIYFQQCHVRIPPLSYFS